MATAVSVSATNNSEIDGLLAGVKWSGTITYSFPDASSDYLAGYGGGEPTATGFSQAPSQMQAAINYAVSLILGYTNATIQYAGTNSADLMIAQSSAANPTSYAYYPGNYVEGGDVWFGTAYNYSLASLGNYYFTTALHEFGHALGLKHSQETGGVANVAVPTAHDDLEYTLMSYRSYVGGPLTGYTNEAYGYPQTYMANDILALQTMYGANYSTHSENTVYTWSATTGQEFINGVAQLAPGGGAGGSANRVFETIWDGGGVDTYDLSNYATNLTLNLNPGAVSLFSSTQLAYLGNNHYASGNLYNAYLYNGDTRSYIDNAIGGSGNDTIVGNAIANVLNGGTGNDTITGGGGNDTIVGGAGTDTAVYSGNRANYAVSYNASTQTFTVTDLRGGSPDGTDALTGVEYLQFADGTIAMGAPVLTASNLQETASWSPAALSNYLAYSDSAGLPAVIWRIQDVSSDGTNALLLNGNPLSASLPVNLTPAQFAQITVGAVTSSHEIWAVANDGAYWSSPVHLTVSPSTRGLALGPPVLTPSNFQETAGWSPVVLSSHLIYTDPGNLAAVTWRIQDVSSDGTSALLLNGSPLSASLPVNLTPAQFAQITVGAVTSSHEIWAVANDGTYWSSPVHLTISPPTASTALGPPVLTPSDLQETSGWSPVGLSPHLIYSDPANLAAVTWRIQDVSSDGTSALLLNGSPLSASLPINLTPAQFAQLSVGAVTSSHEIWAVVNDGTYWSSPVHFTVSPPPAALTLSAIPLSQPVRPGIAGSVGQHSISDNFVFVADPATPADSHVWAPSGVPEILATAAHTADHFSPVVEDSTNSLIQQDKVVDTVHHLTDFHIL